MEVAYATRAGLAALQPGADTYRSPMLTSAITAAITAVLTWLGVPPGPYIAGVWIAVKILVVTAIGLLGWRAARRRNHATPPPTGGG